MNTLHIPRHTILSSLTTVISTFTLSGLYHGYGSYSLAYPTPNSLHATIFDRFWRFFIFFELQALGIVLEDVGPRAIRRWRAVGKGKENGGGPWDRVLGYLWVAGWLFGTGSVLLDSYLKSEMGMVGMQPSFVEGVLKAVITWRGKQ
jgi:hypothetical protein